MIETSLYLPRNAFSAREAARAGDVWRAFQDVAVEASIRAGWPPERYREEGTSFVVRSMRVRHAKETHYGEPITGRTWVSRMRREMLCTREVRLTSARGEIASARQEWVHVSSSLEPTRAGAALLEAFPVLSSPPDDTPPELAALATPAEPHAPHVFSFTAWWTWMDPLDHANHPAYVDWCDEALSRAMHAASIAPVRLVPVAEELVFRSGVVAGEDARVETLARGHTADGAAVLAHRVLVGDRLCATATTVRRVLGEEGPSSLIAAVARR